MQQSIGITHRPWPAPHRRWTMAQSWHDLLFAHWLVDTDVLRALVPRELPLDTFAGQAWIGVVPFRMTGVRPRGVPAVPWLSAFPELNVRTYVTLDGKPGVWFFSLEAANPVAVEVARRRYGLPYFNARMTCVHDSEAIEYRSVRTHRGAEPAAFEGRYRPLPGTLDASVGSLQHWLTARYCLYVVERRQVLRREIDHLPWPLQPAEADIRVNTMTAPLGIELPGEPPVLSFARRLDVVVFPAERAG